MPKALETMTYEEIMRLANYPDRLGDEKFFLGQFGGTKTEAVLRRSGYYAEREGVAVMGIMTMLGSNRADGSPKYSMDDLLDENRFLKEKKEQGDYIQEMLKPVDPELPPKDQKVDPEKQLELETLMLRGMKRFREYLNQRTKKCIAEQNFLDEKMMLCSRIAMITGTNWMQNEKFLQRIGEPREKEDGSRISIEEEVLGEGHTIHDLVIGMESVGSSIGQYARYIVRCRKNMEKGFSADKNRDLLGILLSNSIMLAGIQRRAANVPDGELANYFPNQQANTTHDEDEMGPQYFAQRLLDAFFPRDNEDDEAVDAAGVADTEPNKKLVELAEMMTGDPMLQRGAVVLGAQNRLFRDLDYSVSWTEDHTPRLDRLEFDMPTRKELLTAAYTSELDVIYEPVDVYMNLPMKNKTYGLRDTLKSLGSLLKTEGGKLKKLADSWDQLLMYLKMPLESLADYEKLKDKMEDFHDELVDLVEEGGLLKGWINGKKEDLLNGLKITAAELEQVKNTLRQTGIPMEDKEGWDAWFAKQDQSPENQDRLRLIHEFQMKENWVKFLAVDTLTDIKNKLPLVETAIASMKAGGRLPVRKSPILSQRTVAARKAEFEDLYSEMKDKTSMFGMSREWEVLKQTVRNVRKISRSLEPGDKPKPETVETLHAAVEIMKAAATAYVQHKLQQDSIEKANGKDRARLALAKRIESAAVQEMDQTQPEMDKIRRSQMARNQFTDEALTQQYRYIKRMLEQLEAGKTDKDHATFKVLLKNLKNVQDVQSRLLIDKSRLTSGNQEAYFGKDVLQNTLDMATKYLRYMSKANDGKKLSGERIMAVTRLKNHLSMLLDSQTLDAALLQEENAEQFQKRIDDSVTYLKNVMQNNNGIVPEDKKEDCDNALVALYVDFLIKLEKYGIDSKLCGSTRDWEPTIVDQIRAGQGHEVICKLKETASGKWLLQYDSKIIPMMMDPKKREKLFLKLLYRSLSGKNADQKTQERLAIRKAVQYRAKKLGLELKTSSEKPAQQPVQDEDVAVEEDIPAK